MWWRAIMMWSIMWPIMWWRPMRRWASSICSRLIILMNSRIICSDASKSAITPSFSGRMVLMFWFSLPCMALALVPTAAHFPVSLSMATIDGSSMTFLSFMKMTVLAVPRSMASSCCRNENAISRVFFINCSGTTKLGIISGLLTIFVYQFYQQIINMKRYAVIVAGGKGLRMGSDRPKQFLEIGLN